MAILRPVLFVLFLAMVGGSATVAPYGSSVGSALGDLPQQKDFQVGRVSSFDTTGGNADGGQAKPIKPGETRELAKIDGPGAITHIWVTIASKDENHLRNLVLRMYWDGRSTPCVESPIGDFFGLGHAKYYQYDSAPIQLGTSNGMNCFWRMPFRRGARVTLTNEGPLDVRAFYYYVDYQKYDSLPDGALYFHAHYRQEFPCTPGQNYVFLDTTGRGHYVGVNLSIHNRTDGWWGEGDDMIYIDGGTTPQLNGTGSEDYFGGAWCYGPAFSDLYLGCPLRGEHKTNELWNVYRYHIEDPIPFTRSIRVTIEHGHANDRQDNFSSVAYWYQDDTHEPLPSIPPAEQRIPKPAEPPKPYFEADAQEAEDSIGEWEGGEASVQDMVSFGKWSAGKHLWFTPGGPATYTRKVNIDSSEGGDFVLEMWYTAAPDYGTVEMWVNGVKAGGWDGYNDGGVVRKKVEIPMSVKGGENVFELRITGKNEASSGYMAGLDCWRAAM